MEDKYQSYVVKLKDGSAVMGMIRTETGPSITLYLVDGSEKTILRSDLASIENTGRSLMPEGLGEQIGAQRIFQRGSRPPTELAATALGLLHREAAHVRHQPGRRHRD